MTRSVPLPVVRRAADAGRGVVTRLRTRGDRGQATAEYGLIILAAGGIALGVIAWASGTGSFTDMFEAVVDKLSETL
jgi:Flp pilus assembly pilin Flp